MDITVMTKKRYEQLISDIKNLETQIAMANSQLRAIQDSNNQLAEIAFDENKFTQQLLDKVDEVAREAAKDAVDMDDITSEVQDNIDISEDVERAVNRMDLVDEAKVHDMIEEYVNDNNLLNTDEVEEVVAAYLEQNEYITQPDMEDYVDRAVQELVREVVKEELVGFVHQMMHAVAGTYKHIKENTNANDSRDTSIQVSGTNGQGEATSNGALVS